MKIKAIFAARILCATFCLFGMSQAVHASVCPSSGGPSVQPRQLYGDRIAFDIFRNDQKVGEHVTTFSQQDGRLLVDSDMSLKVKFLFFTAYRYHYKSTETWCGDRLAILDSQVNDNGDKHEVSAVATPQGLAVTAPSGEMMDSALLMPTTHWNENIVDASKVLNTITGNVNKVIIKDMGEATVSTPDGPREARHYAYTGDLDTEVWYDQLGRWVKLRFKAKDGSTIEYVCHQCGTQGGETSK